MRTRSPVPRFEWISVYEYVYILAFDPRPVNCDCGWQPESGVLLSFIYSKGCGCKQGGQAENNGPESLVFRDSVNGSGSQSGLVSGQ